MNSRELDKIRLCLNEMLMIRQLLDKKVADDFCCRLLGIYVMMRADDVTKIWSHHIEKASPLRGIADKAKETYNNKLRIVRDKLGAHFQVLSADNMLGGNIELFRCFDYANTACLIDDIFEAESKIEGKDVNVHGFENVQDFNCALKVLSALYSDDKATITNGVLDIAGINKGGLLTTMKAQNKGQFLRSIEVMVSVAAALIDAGYQSAEVMRMFKRLYVCMVYNYHDNMITRKDLPDNAVQYEEGFDMMFLNLITKPDNRPMLEGAFDQFEKRYGVEAVIRKYRKVRDHACAHFDESSSAEEINAELDALDISELRRIFADMLKMFNYICNNVFTLKMLAIRPRHVIHGTKMERMKDAETFYGEKDDGMFPAEMTNVEVMRSIRKRDERLEEAVHTMQQRLMSHDDEVYDGIMTEISNRFREPNITDEELATIVTTLNNAKRGYPVRLQRSIIYMLQDDEIFKLHNAHLLWLMAQMCREDENIDICNLLASIIIRKKSIPTALALQALLHLIVEKNHKCVVAENKAHDVDGKLIDYISGIKSPVEKCATLLMMIQHWHHDMEYSFYRTYETCYTEYFDIELRNALKDYFKYVKLNDDTEEKVCWNYFQTRHYLLLLYRLTLMEEKRLPKNNLFLAMWKYNCFTWYRGDLYEAIGVGLMTEKAGNRQRAKMIFESLAEDYPLNDDAQITLSEFRKRNPDLYWK